MTILASLFVAALLVGAWLWSINRDLTHPPEEQAGTTVDTAPLSSVTVPLAIDARALEEIAATLPRAISIPRTTHSVRIGLARISAHSEGEVSRGPIRISAAGGGLVASTQIAARARLFRGSASQTVRARADVTAKIKLDVTEGWKLAPKISIDYTWLERPHLRLLGRFNVSLGGVADGVIRPQLRRIEREAPAEIARRLPLRPTMDTLWQQFAQPLALDETGGLWLVLEPVSVHLASPRTMDGVLHVAPAVTARLRVVHGPRPPDIEIAALPALNKAPPATDGIVLATRLEAGYEALRASLISTIATRPLSVEVPDLGTVTATIDDFRVYPSYPRVVVGARLAIDAPGRWFDARGWVYLYGTPAYDNDSMRLSVADLDFSRDTDNAAVQFLSAGLRDVIRDSIRRGADVDVSQQVTALREEANGRLNTTLGDIPGVEGLDESTRQMLGARLRLEGTIDQLSAGTVIPTQDALWVNAEFKGRLTLRLDPEVDTAIAARSD